VAGDGMAIISRQESSTRDRLGPSSAESGRPLPYLARPCERSRVQWLGMLPTIFLPDFTRPAQDVGDLDRTPRTAPCRPYAARCQDPRNAA
jgi:hypothetical protein